MKRRTFISALAAGSSGGIMTAQTATRANKTRFYRLEQFYLKNGTQGTRLAEYLKDGLMPGAMRLGVPGPRIVLEALVAAHMPQVAVLTGYISLEEMDNARVRLGADATLSAALAKWEAGEEPPYEHRSETLLETTVYSPEIPAPAQPPKTPRIFELRMYHSPSERQLKALHERFAGPEIQIFQRCGIHPVFYSATRIGPMMPNLVYLIPFDDLAAREKAWAAFGADPEWVKVRAESIARSGQISSVIQISLYRAAAYSPVR
jgi:hypothetical protein